MNTSEIPSWESLADEPLDAQDGRILNRVARLFDRIDPVPNELVERLQFAISLEALNAELAELQQLDSLSAARGADETKTLTFTSESLTTMVTVTEAGPDRVRIDGWCAPGAGASVELRQVANSIQVEADEDGRFVFDDVAHGLTRFVVRKGHDTGANPVITPAVEL
jgi:hypothetical protein